MTLYQDVKQVLEKIQPYLKYDGGDCQLVEVKNGFVKLRLTGACSSCVSSNITLKNVIERILMEELPGQIKEVKQV